ncbi:hypothetical protein K8R32_01125 [bacterium]|nr:hypothetical protein [bacterium]
MESTRSVKVRLEKDEQKLLNNGFSHIKKRVRDFFIVQHDFKLGAVAVITFHYGKIIRAHNGAVLVEVRRPTKIEKINYNPNVHKVFAMVLYLSRQAKAELLKTDCPFYEDCRDIAGDCEESDYSFLKRKKGCWWGFSCLECPFYS